MLTEELKIMPKQQLFNFQYTKLLVSYDLGHCTNLQICVIVMRIIIETR